MRSAFAVASVALLGALAATAQDNNNNQTQPAAGAANETKTIFQLAAENQNLSSLAQLITSPGFEAVPQLLNGTGTFTIFAPSNDALSAANLNTSDVGLLNNVLLYHVLDKAVASTDLQDLQFPTTSLKNSTYVNLDGGAQVVRVAKSNSSVVVSYGLGQANVTTADVKASNGIIHIIDSVLAIPKKPSETAVAGNFTTLVELLKKTNLTDTLDNLDAATIFAPTNEAFAKLGNKTASLSNDDLTKILKLHVIPSVAYSKDVTDGKSVASVNGEDLQFKVVGTNVTVNGAAVIKPDVLTWNGVVHVIDAVLLPGSKNGGNATNGTGNANGTNPSSGSSRVEGTVGFLGVMTALVALLA